MSIRLLRGDCRATLATVEPGSVQSAITSPPYYGLRNYGTPPLVWGGDGREHEHEWGTPNTRMIEDWQHGPGDMNSARNPANGTNRNPRANGAIVLKEVSQGSVCPCGAWLGSLGLEPTPELYIEHLVECFRAVRRVLADTGTCWVNLGDSYCGSSKGPSGVTGFGGQANRQGFHDVKTRAPGLKPKDLMMLPARVALALQQDGWWLRSMIPWLKRNAMPESVTDRPATSVEYVFLLSKSRTYYWDADAVKQGVSGNAHSRGNGVNPKSLAGGYAPGQDTPNMPRLHRSKQNASFSGAVNELVTSRNRRNGDWFFESWQGLMLNEQDDPLALVVNPQPFSGAHFATFPPKLVEPMVKASTRPGDVVLDCFGGAGTVGLVADRLGRNAVLCELSDQYSPMATDRLVGDSPMFTEVEVA